MVSSVLQLNVTGLKGNGTTIELAVEALLLNKIWTTRMVCKHVSTALMSLKKACFYRKNALQHEALNQVYSVVIAN